MHERDGRVRVLVDDDGPGIAEAERERVFERFVRLDEHRAAAIGGRRRRGARACRSCAASPSATTAPPSVDTAPLGGARLVLDLPAAPRGSS